MTKNIPKEEGLFMAKTREYRRKNLGKDTIFERRRKAGGPLQLISNDKLDRIADRYAHDLQQMTEIRKYQMSVLVNVFSNCEKQPRPGVTSSSEPQMPTTCREPPP
jgi:hypothetical protein